MKESRLEKFKSKRKLFFDNIFCLPFTVSSCGFAKDDGRKTERKRKTLIEKKRGREDRQKMNLYFSIQIFNFFIYLFLLFL